MSDQNKTTGSGEPIALSRSRERMIFEQTLLKYVTDAKKILEHLKELDQALDGNDIEAMVRVREITKEAVEKIVGGKTADPILEGGRSHAAIFRGVQAVNMLMQHGYYRKTQQESWWKWEITLKERQYDITAEDVKELITNFKNLQIFIPSI